jgi:hypothetical protein
VSCVPIITENSQLRNLVVYLMLGQMQRNAEILRLGTTLILFASTRQALNQTTSNVAMVAYGTRCIARIRAMYAPAHQQHICANAIIAEF